MAKGQRVTAIAWIAKEPEADSPTASCPVFGALKKTETHIHFPLNISSKISGLLGATRQFFWVKEVNQILL